VTGPVAGPAAAWPARTKVACLTTALLALDARTTEHGVVVTRALDAFRAQHATPPGTWIRLCCTDPSASPGPEWFVRQVGGLGESAATIPPDEPVRATIHYLPGTPVQDELRRLVDGSDADDLLRAQVERSLGAADPGHLEAVLRDLFGALLARPAHDLRELAEAHAVAARQVVALRRRREADAQLLRTVTVSASLLDAVAETRTHDGPLRKAFLDFYAADGHLQDRLAPLADALVELGLDDLLSACVEGLREDAARLMTAAREAVSIPAWLDHLYRAAPMVGAAMALADLLHRRTDQARAAGVATAEDERLAVVHTALTAHAVDLLDGSTWSSMQAALTEMARDQGLDAARSYALTRLVDRECTYPAVSVEPLLGPDRDLTAAG
jgi:hypothetical protein